jgi:integrase
MRARDPRGKPFLASNPLDHIERPQKQRPEKKVLYLAEVQQMAIVPVPPNEAVARTLWLESALRVSELCRLNVEDVSLGPKKQAILAVTVKGKGRRRERIHIELSLEATRQIQDWLLARNLPGPAEPLLTNQSSRRYERSALYQAVLRWGRAAGITRIRTNPHAIRHLWNLVAREEGIDQVTRARLLNHAPAKGVEGLHQPGDPG